MQRTVSGFFNSKDKAYHKANELHVSLLNYEIQPKFVPSAVLDLYKLYKNILLVDRSRLQNMLVQALRNTRKGGVVDNLNDLKVLLSAVNKVLSFQVHHDVDIQMVSAINRPESQHLQDYINFIKERQAYADNIKKYLLALREEITLKQWTVNDANSGDEHVWIKGVPICVELIWKRLMDVSDKTSDSKVIRIYENVVTDFATAMTTMYSHLESRETVDFYRENMGRMQGFGFVLARGSVRLDLVLNG